MKVTELGLILIAIVIAQPVIGRWCDRTIEITLPKTEVQEIVEGSETFLKVTSAENIKKAADVGIKIPLTKLYDATPELLKLLETKWNAVPANEKTGLHANKNERALDILKDSLVEMNDGYIDIADGDEDLIAKLRAIRVDMRMPIEFDCYRQEMMKKNVKSYMNLDAKTILSKHTREFYKRIEAQNKEAAKKEAAIEKALAKKEKALAKKQDRNRS